MRVLLLTFVIVNAISMQAVGQAQGIQFEGGLTWSKILAKAKSENKYIFMDCYATWCGPCKFMSDHIFTLPNVGDYMNSHFISIKVQMDVTKNDSDDVKLWYADAAALAKQFGVSAYPTYLFFSPEGMAVHRILGRTRDGKEFLSKVENVFDSSKQYYTMIGQYKEHPGDSGYLHNAITVTLNAADIRTAAAIGDMYLPTLTDVWTAGNLNFIERIVQSSGTKAFQLFSDHPEKVDRLLGKDAAGELVRGIIAREELASVFLAGSPAPDWQELYRRLKAKYPRWALQVMEENRVAYFLMKGQWSLFERSLTRYMKRFMPQLNAWHLNDYAWDAFQHLNDPTVLAQALTWSKKCIDETAVVDLETNSNYSNFLDTYANLLYKLGKKEEGITWEQKAVDEDVKTRSTVDIQEHRDALKKMETGAQTW